MRFVANLRDETIAAFAEEGLQPAAYLLSAHRVTVATLERARHVRALGVPLMADNGTKQLLDQVFEEFEPAAAEVGAAARELRRKIGRSLRPADVSAPLRAQAAALAQAVTARCLQLSEAIDTPALITRQLGMDPTSLIAQEDFAIGSLISLGLERELTGWTVARVLSRNRRSIALWRRVSADERCAGRTVYAVLSATDYNTARRAGALAAASGVRSVALGFAGINRNAQAVDHHVMGSTVLRLPRPVPRRYLRLAQIVAGLARGYADAGARLEDFHCLGLGAPSMFAIVAAALPGGVNATLDATSPIHDAVRDKVLYHPALGGERRSLARIVSAVVGAEPADESGADWPLLSPFCRRFSQRFGHEPAAARQWWADNGRPTINSALLQEGNGVTRSLPLFSAFDPDVRLHAQRTHIAHNHWVLDQLSRALDEPHRRDRAMAEIQRWVAGKPSTTTRGIAAAQGVLLRDG